MYVFMCFTNYGCDSGLKTCLRNINAPLINSWTFENLKLLNVFIDHINGATNHLNNMTTFLVTYWWNDLFSFNHILCTSFTSLVFLWISIAIFLNNEFHSFICKIKRKKHLPSIILSFTSKIMLKFHFDFEKKPCMSFSQLDHQRTY